MPKKKQRIPTIIKIIAAIITPVIITVITFYYYGTRIENEDRFFQNISIDGVDVSGLTRREAMQSLGLEAYEERSSNAEVTIRFPDESELVIAGNDVRLRHNAEDIVNEAFTVGRGRGFIQDTITYMERFNTDVIPFYTDFSLDENMLRSIVMEFTDGYNRRLDASTPVIYDDRIRFTKGVGHVSADALDVYEIAFNGIFESMDGETPVEAVYFLPETREFADEILDLRKKIFIQMISSEYDPETVSATGSEIGVDFDPVEAARLLASVKSGQTVEIPFIFTHPTYSQEYLDSILFRDLIGESITTWAHGTANRLTNIRITTRVINGLILLPGEEFSFNGIVGPRTEARGFRLAAAFVGGESVPSYGGGICQTSSTIYAAIRLSGLLVTEQRQHSRTVPYLPRGHDATVVWNAQDFKFVNNTDYPIRIDVNLEDRYLTAEVWGTIIDGFP